MPVRLSRPHGVRGMEELLRNPIYATAIGLLHYARESLGSSAEPAPLAARTPDEIDSGRRLQLPEMFGRMKAWLQGNF